MRRIKDIQILKPISPVIETQKPMICSVMNNRIEEHVSFHAMTDEECHEETLPQPQHNKQTTNLVNSLLLPLSFFNCHA